MIVGFNHNVLYLGVGFHVQTEDGGLKSPSLVTLLYHGGIIVSSQKTSYADILGVEDLNTVVEDLAKEQHKGMLRRLTKGEFDQRILELGIAIEAEGTADTAPSVVEEAAAEAPEAEPAAAGGVEVEEPLEEAAPVEDSADAVAEAEDDDPWFGEEIEELDPVPLELDVAASVASGEDETVDEDDAVADEPEAIEPAFEPPSAEDRGTRQNVSEALDDLIFSYLTGGDEKA